MKLLFFNDSGILVQAYKMKSAYELAMERMGIDRINHLSNDIQCSEWEQKKAISEIDAKYKAKIAEKKFSN